MANKLDPMDIKQILVLLKDGFSNRGIGAILGISRNTVNTYVKQFNSSGYSIGELLNFDESRLNELFTSKTTIDVSRHDDLMLYLEHINAARSHPGFTFQYHYNDYAANVINPYSYTQFMEHFHRKYMRVKGSMKLEHIAGHEMFVDFAGKKLHLTYQRIYYPLREMTFFSIEDLNREIRRLLTEYNKLLFKRKEASRLELFQTIERGYLKPLPVEQYRIKDYRRAKVQKMGYVYFSPDKSYYSVPYRYIGKHTQIHYTQKYIEVYHNHQRIAIHQRNYTRGSYNTNSDHLSSTHQSYLDWNPDYFKNKAAAHGEHVVSCVEHILASVDYPEIGYKRAVGLLQLHKAYGSGRLNKASLFYNESNNMPSHIPHHQNIRGASSYS